MGYAFAARANFAIWQSYLFFWDKLNKANYYLELAIENADLPVDDRLVQYLAKELISDGGQWDMAVNLLEVRLILFRLYSSGPLSHSPFSPISHLFHEYRPTVSFPSPSIPSPSTPPYRPLSTPS